MTTHHSNISLEIIAMLEISTPYFTVAYCGHFFLQIASWFFNDELKNNSIFPTLIHKDIRNWSSDAHRISNKVHGGPFQGPHVLKMTILGAYSSNKIPYLEGRVGIK